jgi:hypothetical protein
VINGGSEQKCLRISITYHFYNSPNYNFWLFVLHRIRGWDSFEILLTKLFRISFYLIFKKQRSLHKTSHYNNRIDHVSYTVFFIQTEKGKVFIWPMSLSQN